MLITGLIKISPTHGKPAGAIVKTIVHLLILQLRKLTISVNLTISNFCKTTYILLQSKFLKYFKSFYQLNWYGFILWFNLWFNDIQQISA